MRHFFQIVDARPRCIECEHLLTAEEIRCGREECFECLAGREPDARVAIANQVE
jgi:hypothetical protein